MAITVGIQFFIKNLRTHENETYPIPSHASKERQLDSCLPFFSVENKMFKTFSNLLCPFPWSAK